MFTQEINHYVSWKIYHRETVNNNYFHLWKFNELCDKRIDQITSSDIEMFESYLDQHYASQDVQYVIDLIGDFLEYCSHLFYINDKVLWYVNPNERGFNLRKEVAC